MKKSISLLAGLLVLSACTNEAAYSKSQLNQPKKAFNTNGATLNSSYVESVKDFALDFYNALDVKENQVFSPLSIATCFSMLYDGTDGKTREEIANMLHYDDSENHLNAIKNMLLKTAIDDKNNKTYLDISQSIWFAGDGSQYIKSYVDKITDYYYAEAFQNVGFNSQEGKEQMAGWVNDKTKNFLNVKSGDFQTTPNTLLYLMNTIYVKSPWSIEDLFKKSNNKGSDFKCIDGNNSQITFMHGKDNGAYYLKKDEYRIASLPYKRNIKINILLPNEGTNYSEVLSNKDALKDLINFKQEKTEYTKFSAIAWKLPKFKLVRSYGLETEMKKLGLNETFDKEKVNLSRMITDKNIYIESTYHKAGIELNNEGVEAAAVTYASNGAKSAMEPSYIEFHVDHPFAYYLTTNEELPLFMGVVNKLS